MMQVILNFIKTFLETCLAHQEVAHICYPTAHLYYSKSPFTIMLNLIAQPLFLCILTPQAVLNVLILPFFILALVRHYRKFNKWLLWIIVYGVFITKYNGVSESLIRHRMSIELFYYAIGMVGVCSLKR